ncbi:nicotinamide-nucleotide amidohydrolase family protein [Arthrobacter sp. AK01]|uniref:CinA family protein n=1 Tax=Micrococcaceae TaxID=1268 RepID=UPI001E61EDFE|nr:MULTISPECIES: nicotinamide-nucleotide amidohydrolase family protein [Micrococcaceae]MCD4850206.1 nicotinamide-nucleotide amidohydrolase family protein [Arthrobacter sp. AK01]MCP1413325.1 nicotinamide-nucleotide amidase [Paenarthrobacter sp. A20]
MTSRDGGGETATAVVGAAIAKNVTVATAESLTAGMVAAALASTPGASGMLQGGVVAYQNSVKAGVLGVPEELLAVVGSVDGAVAKAMADGARRACAANVGISTTGVAGPESHDGKAVGTVFVGIATDSGTEAFEYGFSGDRQSIREQARDAALARLLAALTDVGYRS